MKYNREPFWLGLGIFPLMLIYYVVVQGKIDTTFSIFLIFSGILVSVGTFWNNHYFSSLEETLHTFSDRHNGTVTLVNVVGSDKLVEYVVKGEYYDRAFHIKTERTRHHRDYSHTMKVSLEIYSSVITSLKLKRKRWGKVDLDPSTIADVYDIHFTIQKQIPIVGGFYDEQFVMFKNEFISLIDQREIGKDISKLGKRYSDFFGRFYIFTNGENIRIDKCSAIRSVDELEKLMRSLKDIAEIIEVLSKDHSMNKTV